MAVITDVAYDGDLHCTAIHRPSGDRLPTDAPVDNRGKGEHFSPTDLLGAALGTCVLTLMGIASRDRCIDMSGARAEVVKEMGAEPRRHISRLTVRVTLPAALTAKERTILERAGRHCPVEASLGPQTVVDLTFVYA